MGKYTFLYCVATIIIIAAACRHAHAEGVVYHGIAQSSSIVSSCSENQDPVEIFLVLDTGENGRLSGEFYGENTSPGLFRQNESGRFDVTYPETQLYKLPPATLELTPTGSGYTFVLRDAAPADPELKDSVCWHTLLTVELTLLGDSPSLHRQSARDLFANCIATYTSSDLLFKEKEYQKAQEMGFRVQKEAERLRGQFSKESLNGLAIVAASLMMQERFDEALEAIAPFRTALPNHANLKRLEDRLIELKKEQDELFRYDPDGNDDVDMEPLA
jgi:hypothetical protein